MLNFKMAIWFSLLPALAGAQCTCDLILHDRTTGDGLQALDFASMPDSTSVLFIHNDSSGWLELLSDYSSIMDASGTVQPGTRICLKQLVRRLYLENVVGDSLSPIVIQNYPGTVAEISGEPTYAGLQLHDSRYFEVRGDCGLPDSVHGLFIHGVNSNGVEVSGRSEQFVITRVKVDTAGTGIKVKDNRDGYFASCTPASGVTAPSDSAWYASNITVMHCFLTNLINEGIYMNNTSYKYDYNCDENRLYYGYEMDAVYLTDNVILNAGKDGIQATGVVRDCRISGNRILNVGTDGAAAQGNGIHFGEGSSGSICNNWVEKTTGDGIFSAGLGVIEIYQNVILQPAGDGIRAHAGTAKCEGSCKYSHPPAFFDLNNYYDLERLSIYNNTVAFTTGVGINIDAPLAEVQMKKVYVNNNIITEWGTTALDFISAPTANYDGFTHAGNNLIVADVSEAGFVNGGMNLSGAYGPDQITDVRLTATSYACDAGIDLLWTTSTPAVWMGGDFEGSNRELQSRIDCGAYESNYTMPAGQSYRSSAACTCALPGAIYGFDGTGLGDDYTICLLDTLRTGRTWFQNLEGTVAAPVRIAALEETTWLMSYNSNAISFKNVSHIELSGAPIHLSAVNAAYANVDFISGNSGNLLIEHVDIAGSDDLIDIASGSGTNLFDSVRLKDVRLYSNQSNSNLLRIKGQPLSVQLLEVYASSDQLNQTLMEVNLKDGGSLGIYNSVFDGFDTDQSLFKWIQLTMQPVNGSYEAQSVKLVNNTLVNLANSNTSSTTSNFRILHKAGTGFIDTLLFVNNAIHKSAIQSSLTVSNYRNTANQISVFTANYAWVQSNFSTQVYDSLHIDVEYVPEQVAHSPLVNSGTDLSNSEVRDFDFYGRARPDSVYLQADIGACELQPVSGGYSFSSALSSSAVSASLAFEAEPALTLYPNPVAEVLKVTGLQAGDQVIISDAQGKLVFDQMMDQSRDLGIAVRSWQYGRYYLRVIQQEEDVFYRHVLVKR